MTYVYLCPVLLQQNGVKRFSRYKNILLENNRRFYVENIENTLVVEYNKSTGTEQKQLLNKFNKQKYIYFF